MHKYVLAVLILVSVSTCYSQPRFTMQFTAGYSAPLPDLKGEFGPTLATYVTNNPDTATYYMKHGFNFGIYGKKGFGKTSQIRVTGSLIFNYFSQNKEYNDSGRSANVKLSQNILSITLGGEWCYVTKTSSVNPFAGADLMLNFFSGSFQREQFIVTSDKTLKSAIRFGIQAGGGLDIRLSRNVGTVVGFKYSIANLIGKKEGTDVGTTYALADVRYGKNRTISYLQFYGGVSFYFGY